jgi:class 3 adenylate cyclase
MAGGHRPRLICGRRGRTPLRKVCCETPNLLARLQAVTASGTVVIGPTTRRRLAGLFEYRDVGRIEVKGALPLGDGW